MQTIAIISQKGGVGKTTISTHLGVAGTLDGLGVAIADVDPQSSAEEWFDERKSAAPEVIGVKAKRLPKLIEAAQEDGLDLIVIDTPAGSGEDALEACKAADLVLIPVVPAFYDIAAAIKSWSLCETVKKPAWIILSRCPIRSAVVDEARQLLVDKGMRVGPHLVYERVACKHSAVEGRTALEWTDPKAAEEFKTLFSWVHTQVRGEGMRDVAA